MGQKTRDKPKDFYAGHRQRLKDRFLARGLDGFEDHHALELLLFFALPQGDVSDTARELILRFGSFSAVFDAPYEALTEVDGIGRHAATLIKLIPHIARRYQISRCDAGEILNSAEKAGKYLLPRFFGERDEVVYMVCCDSKRKVLSCKAMFRGDVNSANVSIRKLVENALNLNASSVILAHNHLSGIAIPSAEDEMTTRRLKDALWSVGIELSDHIIVADDDFVSMSDSGMLLRERGESYA